MEEKKEEEKKEEKVKRFRIANIKKNVNSANNMLYEAEQEIQLEKQRLEEELKTAVAKQKMTISDALVRLEKFDDKIEKAIGSVRLSQIATLLLNKELPVVLFNCLRCGFMQAVEFGARNTVTKRYRGGMNRSLWAVEWSNLVCRNCGTVVKLDRMIATRSVQQETEQSSADEFVDKLEQLLNETFQTNWEYETLMEHGTIHLDVIVPYLNEEEKIVEEKSNAR